MKRLVGNKAPEFNVGILDADGESFGSKTLEDYKGKWLILLFYPMDFTFVCPTELTAFSAIVDELERNDTELLAISTDSIYSHLAWVKNGLGKLNYPLGADQNLKMSQDYGVLLEDEGVALRGLFIISDEQEIKYSVIHDNNIGRNPSEVLRVLSALKTGGLCGANWSQGEANLIPELNRDTDKDTKKNTNLSEEIAVKVYSLPDCSYCKSVKEYLTQQNIKFIEIDLSTDKDGQEFMDNRRYKALPVTVIGETEISGYDMPKIKSCLKLT